MVDLDYDKYGVELNLENPIFVLYLNVRGFARSKIDQTILSVREHIKYNNVTFWIIPIGDNDSGNARVEMIWRGSKNMNYDTNFINEVCSILVSDISDGDKILKIRDIKINNLI